MGLEIPEEFWPITPIQTITKPRTAKINHHNNKDNNKENNKENTNEDNVMKQLSSSKNTRVVVDQEEKEEEECVTPKAEAQLLKTPLVCPPAPRKPPPVPRKRKLSSQGYYQIPIGDIDYLFMEVITVPTKKIKAA